MSGLGINLIHSFTSISTIGICILFASQKNFWVKSKVSSFNGATASCSLTSKSKNDGWEPEILAFAVYPIGKYVFFYIITYFYYKVK